MMGVVDALRCTLSPSPASEEADPAHCLDQPQAAADGACALSVAMDGAVLAASCPGMHHSASGAQLSLQHMAMETAASV